MLDEEHKDIVLMLFLVAHVGSSSKKASNAKILVLKKDWKISIFRSVKLNLKFNIPFKRKKK